MADGYKSIEASSVLQLEKEENQTRFYPTQANIKLNQYGVTQSGFFGNGGAWVSKNHWANGLTTSQDVIDGGGEYIEVTFKQQAMVYALMLQGLHDFKTTSAEFGCDYKSVPDGNKNWDDLIAGRIHEFEITWHDNDQWYGTDDGGVTWKPTCDLTEVSEFSGPINNTVIKTIDGFAPFLAKKERITVHSFMGNVLATKLGIKVDDRCGKICKASDYYE